jgi:FLVCR family MFS transporter 7
MDSPLQNLVATESTTIYNKNGEEEENIEQVYDIAYKTYKIRFYGLVVIALANIASSLNWYSVAPVPDLASTYFDNIGLSAINWFSNVFMLCYLIAGPISSWVFTHSSVKLGVNIIIKLFS